MSSLIEIAIDMFLLCGVFRCKYLRNDFKLINIYLYYLFFRNQQLDRRIVEEDKTFLQFGINFSYRGNNMIDRYQQSILRESKYF